MINCSQARTEHPFFILVLVFISRACRNIPCSVSACSCALISRAGTSFIFACSCSCHIGVNIPSLCLFFCLFHVCEYSFFMLVLALISRVWTSLVFACSCAYLLYKHPTFMLVHVLISRVWTSLLYACSRAYLVCKHPTFMLVHVLITCVNIPSLCLFLCLSLV